MPEPSPPPEHETSPTTGSKAVPGSRNGNIRLTPLPLALSDAPVSLPARKNGSMNQPSAQAPVQHPQP
ncbi:hypothetical protein ACFVRU_53780, partial [Streptomyces sp. NPDC057927]